MASDESNKALVIGNGESRRNVDLNLFSDYTLIGCNAIHRDFKVDHLICCDRRMAEEATNNENIQDTKVYVRESWHHYFRKIKKNKNVLLLPDLPYVGESKKDHPDHWGSGGYAVLLAATLGFKEIELLGFDLYPKENTVNNIYKGTINYAKEGAQAIDYSFWVYQIAQLFKHFPNTTFTIRNNQHWIMPTEWQKSNVKFLAL